MLKRLLSASVLFAAIPAFSQGGPGGGMDHGPMGLMVSMRTPVTNAPYSATFTTTSTEKLQDGSVLNHSSMRIASRDSLGRTREEVTLPARSGAAASATPHTMVVIVDPVAHTVTQLRTEQKVAVVHAIPQLPAGATHRQFPGALGGEPPVGPDGAGVRSGDAGHPHGPHADKNVAKVDLGSQTISGVVATGKRTTRTIPAGEMGNAAPLVSTHEEWFSPDLKIEVSRTDVDPFHGTRTMAATTLSKSEPDAALFKIPTGFAVQQAPQRVFGRRGPGGPHQPGDMPPSPQDGIVPAPGL